MYGSITKGDVVKRSDCILVYGSTTKGDVVRRSDCILVYGSITKGDVVKRSDCILVYGSTTKGDVVRRSDCILVYGSTTKGDVVYDTYAHTYAYTSRVHTCVMTSLQDLLEHSLVGPAIRVGDEHVNISTSFLPTAIGTTCDALQASVDGVCQFTHLLEYTGSELKLTSAGEWRCS